MRIGWRKDNEDIEEKMEKVTLEVEEELLVRAEKVSMYWGLDLSSLIRLFLRVVAETGRIPFIWTASYKKKEEAKKSSEEETFVEYE